MCSGFIGNVLAIPIIFIYNRADKHKMMVKVTNLYGDIAIGAVDKVAVYQRFYGKSVRRKWDGKKKNTQPQQLLVQQRFRNGIDFASSLSVDERKFLSEYVEAHGLKMTWQNYAKNICMAQVIADKSRLLSNVKQPSYNPIKNGGFETGDFSNWIIDGFTNPPSIATSPAHSGNFTALIGNYGGGEPYGDSSIYQEILVPYFATLIVWYYPYSTDGIYWDWQDGYITDLSGTILTTLFHLCDRSNAWTKLSFDLTAFGGQRVRLKFLVHQDGAGDPTGMFIDDIAILTPADYVIPSIKGTIVLKHPAIKQIVLYDPAGNVLSSESGLTDLASGVITTGKSWDLDLPIGTAYIEVTTADNRVHRIPL